MLKTRSVTKDDIEKIRELHDKYYSEWEFPNFLKCLCGFVIEDEDDEIIMAGCIEKIAETSLVTNKEQNRIKIGRALIEARNISLYVCEKCGIDELVAFVNNEEYARHLVRHGFNPRSTALSIRVENG